MCIGIPMRVVEPMGLTARVSGRNGSEVVDLRLVGQAEAGQWLLVFQGAARERLDAQRAAEIDAALDLLQAGLAGGHDAARPADPGFALPSAMSAQELAALTRPR
jgi:hydrogenase expression/formation protein HypC